MQRLTIPQTQYILNTMQDGVIAVNETGKVTYINKIAANLMSADPEKIVGQRLIDVFFENEKNDEFNQTVIDAVCAPNQIVSKKLKYWYKENEYRYFHVKTSIIQNEEQKKQGVTFLITDITAEEEQKHRIHDLTVNFVLFISLLCGYVFFYAFSNFVWGNTLRKTWYNWIVMVFSFVLTGFLSYNTSKKFEFDFLKVGKEKMKKDMRFVIAFCIGTTAFMVVVKLILLHAVPGLFSKGVPFFNYYRYLPGGFTLAHGLYFLTSFFQEILARKVAQETMEEIFTGSKGSILAIFISSFMFGVLHLHYGFLFMIGCCLYLTILGFYYRKNRNIWNCVILHLVLGELFIGFGFGSIGK